MANKMMKRNAILKYQEGREYDYKKDHVLNIKEYFDYDTNLGFGDLETLFLAGLEKAGLEKVGLEKAGLEEAGLEEIEIYFKRLESKPEGEKDIYNLKDMRENKDGNERKRFMNHCRICINFLSIGGDLTSVRMYLKTAGENNGNQYRYYKAMFVVKM